MPATAALVASLALLVAGGCDRVARYSTGDAAVDTTIDGVFLQPEGSVPDIDDIGIRDTGDIGPPDLLPPDTTVDGRPPDAPAPTCKKVAGSPCRAHVDCGPPGSGLFCLITEPANQRGVCSCPCTADNPSTPLVDEDSCGSGFHCAAVKIKSADVLGCLPTCTPRLGSTTCPQGSACDPRSTEYSRQPDVALCSAWACKTNSDCPVATAASCSLTGPSVCSVGHTCVPVALGASVGRCSRAGKCDAASGLCGKRVLAFAGAVGSACKADVDCPLEAYCELERPSTVLKQAGDPCERDAECCTAVCKASGRCAAGLCRMHSRNGYCTIVGCAFATLTQRRCPAGSTCSLLYPGGRCLRTCSVSSATDCRGNPAFDSRGDYECRAWNRLTLGGKQVTTAPVCEWGGTVRCTGVGSVPVIGGLSCSIFADTGSNATGFACRNPETGAKLSMAADLGYCLDTTHSGQ